jgi:hypothetical protein
VRKGGEMWNGTRGILYRFGTHADTQIRDQVGGYCFNWMTDVYPDCAGPGVGVKAFQSAEDWQNWFLGEGGGFGTTGVQFIEDAGFVKLREIALQYTFRGRWLRNTAGFSTLDLRFAGRNIKTWTRYRGLDPETNLGGGEWLTQGVDYFSNPLTRSFVLSFTLNR